MEKGGFDRLNVVKCWWCSVVVCLGVVVIFIDNALSMWE